MSAIDMQATKKVFAKAGKGIAINMTKTRVFISLIVPHNYCIAAPRRTPKTKLLVEISSKPPPAFADVSTISFLVSAFI